MLFILLVTDFSVSLHDEKAYWLMYTNVPLYGAVTYFSMLARQESYNSGTI